MFNSLMGNYSSSISTVDHQIQSPISKSPANVRSPLSDTCHAVYEPQNVKMHKLCCTPKKPIRKTGGYQGADQWWYGAGILHCQIFCGWFPTQI